MSPETRDVINWNESMSLPAIWFRDDYACEDCRDPQSGQKLFKITDLAEGLGFASVAPLDDGVVITFSPDNHRSTFSREWLARQASWTYVDGRCEFSKILWDASDLGPNVQHAEWSEYCSDDETRLRLLKGIETLGFAVLHGTPEVERTVIDLARTFGFVRETNYGELFDVRVEANPNNLAFTGAAISPHTDNPYRDPVPTMQLLHCLSNDVEGGESGLVDGFHAAAILRDQHPEYFDILANTPVTFAWSDEMSALCTERPMIELNPHRQIRGVRFNNRSLETLGLDPSLAVEFYNAYRAFATILERPELMLTFRLGAGDCVIFDNTRILHARTAFDESGAGRRHLQGCYADLDGLASTITVLSRAMDT